MQTLVETAIGPVLHRWLLALEQHVAYFDDGDTAFLYCARAGVRIRRLFDGYLAGRGRALGDRHATLWCSRVALCKALYARVPETAAALIAREFHHRPLREAVAGLLRNAPDRLDALDLSAAELDAPGHTFQTWLEAGGPAARALTAYFAETGDAFDVALASAVGGARRAVLIDSGWQGSAQSLLARAFPETEFHGLYFGRILSGAHDPAIADRVIGLMFEAEAYDPDRPETALALHRHLIESLLEPNGPSIEEVPGGPCDASARAQIAACAHETVSPLHDALFLAAEAWIEARAGDPPAAVMAAARAALPRLARLIVHPSREEALALAGKPRSADFGKSLVVPVLVEPGATGSASGALPADGRVPPDAVDVAAGADHPHARIARSLWPQGQIALEYQGVFAREMQLQASGMADSSAYFDPEAAAAPALAPGEGALVSIITRTKNRPLLLARAARSVAAQSHAAVEWIVVNDGGDEALVREVLAACPVDRRRIRLVSNAHSLGMEAASNEGIAHATGRYLLIHDDDDTLHPDFLARTVGFLEGPGGGRYGGVVTGSDHVSEEIRGDAVIEHDRRPYLEWVRNIQLAELLAQNLFPPIAFLYRRSVYDRIGGYNEELPVLGDWYFNLEFALTSDIAVLPERLAFYHHRDHGDSSKLALYANSVTGGQAKHLEFASVMRNMFMRRRGRADPVAASAIAGYYATDMRTRLERIEARLAEAAAPPPPDAEQTRRATDEIDRLWAMNGLLSRAAERGAAAAQVARALGTGATLDDLRAILRDVRVPIAPHPFFDERAYLAAYPDVAAAVAGGHFASGYEHFLLHGHEEGRTRPDTAPALEAPAPR
ncbi:glycosyltransferase [Rhodovulum sp. 12E13]|uniref:glycosyltransferase n=1 Tax=Rhodovulum sp. 12E13 TaxID=2203891 RepID=UPI000E139AFC|nr:glycosyltransferase [Rhodovulum sp. 12E13]RDC71405.1 glycosyltransferase [Rhodovulum sp. 12E13]